MTKPFVPCSQQRPRDIIWVSFAEKVDSFLKRRNGTNLFPLFSGKETFIPEQPTGITSYVVFAPVSEFHDRQTKLPCFPQTWLGQERVQRKGTEALTFSRLRIVAICVRRANLSRIVHVVADVRYPTSARSSLSNCSPPSCNNEHRSNKRVSAWLSRWLINFIHSCHAEGFSLTWLERHFERVHQNCACTAHHPAL